MSFRLLPGSLVGRVFALYTVVLAGFVLAGLGLFYRYQFTVELEEAQLRAETLSAVVLPTIADSAVIGDYDTIRRTLERAVYHSSFSSASFIDLRGGLVRAPHADAPPVNAPDWLVRTVAERLYDTNQTISVGGRDYGVLRLSFAPERIAGSLWAQTRIAIVLALASLAGGLVLIRFPLVHWLGNLNRVEQFEKAMDEGEAVPTLLAADEAPTEFRATFEVLGRAAANLRSQRTQAAVTLGSIADGVFTLDQSGSIALANVAASGMLGRRAEDMLGRPVAQVLPQLFDAGDELVPWRNRRTTLLAGTREVVVETTLSPILAPDGATVGHVLACRDVSEQHQLDQRLRAELRSREAALVELRKVLEGLTRDLPLCPTGPDDLAAISAMISELVSRLQVRGEQLDAIFALSPDGFVSFDAQRNANYVSPSFSRLTGIAAQAVLERNESEVESLLRAQSGDTAAWRGFAAIRAEARQALDGAAPKRALIELERPTRRVLEIGLREGTTPVISQVLSLRDVTHETLVDQMKSEFLSMAAHELRTPMASIYGFAELLMRRKLSPDKQQEVLQTIHRQSELMVSIVNELLDLARIEARRGLDLELQTLDLGTLVRDVIGDFKTPEGRERPEFVDDAVPAAAQVDRNKMRQAIGNVISNAYKYSSPGSPVAVRIVRESGAVPRVGIEIADRGIGMTADQLARVSERFYRADASGNVPGTGLGMSIVKEIIELLGGRLEMRSEPGQGTVVTLWLPLATAAQTQELMTT